MACAKWGVRKKHTNPHTVSASAENLSQINDLGLHSTGRG